MMKVLLTGAGGMIGRAVLDYLAACPIVSNCVAVVSRHPTKYSREGKIERFGCDLVEWGDTVELVHEAQPDVIFHLAGNASNEADLHQAIHDNIVPTANLLETCPKGTRFVFASSANVYGDLGREKACVETDPLSATSAYTASKIACEKMVEAKTSLGEIDSLILRYVANVSPNPTHGVVKAIFEKISTAKKVSECTVEIDVFGICPGSIKPYMHVEDTAVATVNFGLDPRIKGVVNIGPHDTASIANICKLISVKLNKYFQVNYRGMAWKGDNNMVRIDNNRMHELGFVSYWNSQDAIINALTDMEV